MCLIRNNGNFKTIYSRGANPINAVIAPRIMKIKTHGDELKGIAFNEKVLDKCVIGVNYRILVKHLKLSKVIAPTSKEENNEKTEIEHDRQM